MNMPQELFEDYCESGKFTNEELSEMIFCVCHHSQAEHKLEFTTLKNERILKQKCKKCECDITLEEATDEEIEAYCKRREMKGK